MSKTISPNRSELIIIKKKITTAKKGYNLLKKKRDGLIMEFFKLFKNAKDLKSEMIDLYIESKKSLNRTRIISDDLRLRFYSKIVKSKNLIDFNSVNVMGLSIPQIKAKFKSRDLFERESSTFKSYNFNETIKKHEELLSKIIMVAEIETTLLKLLDEIKKTKRRVNGLEFNIIPNLEKNEKFVTLSLEEQERDNTVRLKKIKKKLAQS
jgi:V/A-type H+/Na+-transporting ATPase subunit D